MELSRFTGDVFLRCTGAIYGRFQTKNAISPHRPHAYAVYLRLNGGISDSPPAKRGRKRKAQKIADERASSYSASKKLEKAGAQELTEIGVRAQFSSCAQFQCYCSSNWQRGNCVIDPPLPLKLATSRLAQRRPHAKLMAPGARRDEDTQKAQVVSVARQPSPAKITSASISNIPGGYTRARGIRNTGATCFASGPTQLIRDAFSRGDSHGPLSATSKHSPLWHCLCTVIAKIKQRNIRKCECGKLEYIFR